MNRLWVRLSAAFLLVAWVGIGAVALVVRQTTETGFRQYLNQREAVSGNPDQIARLQAYYAAQGGWQGAEAILAARSGEGGTHSPSRRGAQLLIVGPDGVVQAATDPTAVGEALAPDELAEAAPLVVDGQIVGWLTRRTPGEAALGAAETAFLAEANRWLLAAAGGATALSLAVGAALAWAIARPLRTLTAAARHLAAGRLGEQVAVGGALEIDQLASAFNAMSRDLAAGEALRQRMAADVAHELRTPVSVLRGHLEAMMDGVYPLDGAHLAVVYDQTIHLARLVEDLRLLTQAEMRRLPLERGTVIPAELVAQAVEAFSPLALDAGIRLEQQVEADLPALRADATRVRQVLDNLLTNALRHTPGGGRIAIASSRQGGYVRFSVSNTGSLADEDAHRAFEPFWRAEGARERDRGGSGLGLAISRQLVLLHGGRIWAERAGQETVFAFELPVTGAASQTVL